MNKKVTSNNHPNDTWLLKPERTIELIDELA